MNCNGACAGSGSSKGRGTCPGATQFPEPMPGMSGFGKSIFRFSVVDQVMVPAGLEPGEYLLSWRWDCEQSDQVFQNCADIIITDDSANALESLVSNPNANTDEYHAVGAAGKDIDGCSVMKEADCNAHSECSWTDKNGKKYCAGSTPEGKAEPEPEPESEPETGPEPEPTGASEVSPVTNSSTDPEDTVVPVTSEVANHGMVARTSSTVFSVVIALYF